MCPDILTNFPYPIIHQGTTVDEGEPTKLEKEEEPAETTKYKNEQTTSKGNEIGWNSMTLGTFLAAKLVLIGVNN